MQTADAVAAFLQGQRKEFAKAACAIASGYTPQDMTASTLYVDVMPLGCRSNVERIRRQATGHEDRMVRVLLRKKLPEKVSKESLDTLVSSVECVVDLLLDAQWNEGSHCSSVELSPLFDEDQLAKGVFSSTIIVHIACQWDLQG